ncbi:MAG TPA: efflux RND transporter periplasmic adaptor subunit [Candidatus Acidoferrum sp.]|nr:efflux RND transporter periplasmic adaptor subunit [Candidatus Acidoferrum sp.]
MSREIDDDQDVPERSRAVRWAAGGVAAVALIGLGALGGAYWVNARASHPATTAPSPPAASPTTAAAPRSGTSEEPVEITLTPDAIARVGIKVAPASVRMLSASLTVPGTVTSNAYRETKVNTVIGGIVRQVPAELGAVVRRGDVLAVVFSAELADAQMKYLSMQAMLTADHQKLQRTERLVAIGAASRQELEEVTAVHAAHETEVAAGRQRLILLGLSSEQVGRLRDASHVVSEVTVRSPGDGVVITRGVNPGQVVATGHEAFVVADLTTVWVIADLYEKDFAAVGVGTEASIAIPAAPDTPRRGRVAYIDPRVDAATRTAKVRVEVPNRGDLKLGMFVSVTIVAPGQRVVVVPRTAVQAIGERSVVYVALDEGRFVERPVRLGAPVGEAVAVLTGLQPDERVVIQGSFFLRAEAARSRGSS